MYMYNLWKKSNSWNWYKIHCDEQQFEVHLLKYRFRGEQDFILCSLCVWKPKNKADVKPETLKVSGHSCLQECPLNHGNVKLQSLYGSFWRDFLKVAVHVQIELSPNESVC